MAKYEYSVSLIYDHSTKSKALNLEKALITETQKYVERNICGYFTSSFKIFHNQFEKLVEGPKIMIYFGSANIRKTNIDLLKEAKNAGIFIIPVLDSQQIINDCIPELLLKINIFFWDRYQVPEKKLVREIFENLGLEDKNRRIFISYRRDDGQGMAFQLFDKLSQQKFNIFLDLYDIDVGIDFEERIYESLEDKSFLLVIESPKANKSQWISKEVIYALRHEIPVYVVSWCDRDKEISETFNLPKIKLDINNDLVKSKEFYVIKENLVEGIINEIESLHAYGLNQRRNDFLRSIETSYSKDYHYYNYLQSWVIYFTNSKKSDSDRLITMALHFPQPEDLYYIDNISKKIKDFHNDTKKILFYKAEKLPDFQKEVLEWILNDKKNLFIINQ
ncbi:MAG: toll/interleukin-1 receptor domain-containing protein [Promethearchaeota archaeon]